MVASESTETAQVRAFGEPAVDMVRIHATIIAALPVVSNEPLEKTVKSLHALYAPAAWAEDRELRRLRAQEKKLEEELRQLGGASFTAKQTSGERAVLGGTSASIAFALVHFRGAVRSLSCL
jgi:hypothetical protein